MSAALVAGMAANAFSQGLGMLTSEYDRERNYYWNEKTATNAYNRQRQLYTDFYSPQALTGQYIEAGLSPSLMYGGTPGQGGTSAPQGHGTAGPTSPVYGVSALEAAQIANIMAQTENVKADTKVKEVDAARQEIQRQVEELKTKQFKLQFELLGSYGIADDGSKIPLNEMAKQSKTFEEFSNKVRKLEMSEEMKSYLATEFGQKDLRAMYTAQHQFETNIAILSSDQIAADFQRSITQVLANSEFAEKNKDAAIAYLDANIETSNLTKEQKGAWNDLIEKIKNGAGETTANIVMILAMILNQGMSKWHMPTMNFGGQTYNKYVKE